MLKTALSHKGSFKESFRNENGAIDLASIMVGIVVIGIVGGVIAATVFAVIPWAQDNAAKAVLGSVDTAQSAAAGFGGKYVDYANLRAYVGGGVNTSLIGESDTVTTSASADGSCYISVSSSASSKVFYSTSSNPTPKEYTSQTTVPGCANPVTPLPTLAAEVG